MIDKDTLNHIKAIRDNLVTLDQPPTFFVGLCQYVTHYCCSYKEKISYKEYNFESERITKVINKYQPWQCKYYSLWHYGYWWQKGDPNPRINYLNNLIDYLEATNVIIKAYYYLRLRLDLRHQ